MPDVEITETTSDITSQVRNKLRACIIGGNAKLFRYSNSSEKVLSYLGEYDKDSDTQYDYPNQPENSIVDKNYVKLYADNVLLNYLDEGSYEWNVVAGYTDRIRGTNIERLKQTIWRGNVYNRWSILYDRDVQAGDIVDIRGYVGGEEYTQRTTVKNIYGDIEAADTDLVSEPSDPGTTDDVTITQTEGPYNEVELIDTSDSYDGPQYGYTSDVYTIEVINDSGTLKLQITSDNNDDIIIEAPNIGEEFSVGTHGLKATFICASSSSSWNIRSLRSNRRTNLADRGICSSQCAYRCFDRNIYR